MGGDPQSLLQRARRTLHRSEPTWLGRLRRRLWRQVASYVPLILFGGFAVVGVWLFLTQNCASLRGFLGDYWLLALSLVFVLEGAMLLYFAPSESLVPVAILSFGDATETIVAVLVVATLGATVGQYALFRVASDVGRDAILEHRWIRIGDDQLSRFEGWFDRWGLLAVPVSNALLFTRGMMTIPAGLANMRDRHFILGSALGTIAFESLLALGTLGVLSLPWIDTLAC